MEKTNVVTKTRKGLILIFQIILGATFIFSGFVKAVDPVGYSIKIGEYLTAMGLDFLTPLALLAAIGISAFEFLLGINMLLGMHVRTTYIFTLIFMGIMTPLTLWLAIANPVKDCGCFGDALIISNWATFWKNIVLTAMAVFVFIFRKDVRSPYSEKTQWLTSFSSLIFIVGISFIGYRHLPLFDFRPYKIGTDINEAMKSQSDEYEYSYIYEKNGVQKTFTPPDDVLPVGDSTWKCVDVKKGKLIKKGVEPLIHDFTIHEANTDNGDDITQDILTSEQYIFLLISDNLRNADINHIERINDIYDYAKNNEYGFYCLTASAPAQTIRWKNFTGAEYSFCVADETTLKTIVRSNPGLMLIKNGVIYNKWHYNDFPTEKMLSKPLEQSDSGKINMPRTTLRIILISASFIALLLVVLGLDKLALFVSRRRKRKMNLKQFIFLSFMLLSFFGFSAKSQVTATADMDKSKIKLALSEKNVDAEVAFFSDSLIHYAQKYLGTPYKMGANGTARFDCSGFTSYVYKNFGYALHRTAAGQAQVNGITVTRDSLQKGDLVFFKGRNAKQKRVGHVGIVCEVFPDGTFSFIHASCNSGITITSVTTTYYKTRYVTAKRIFEAPEIKTVPPPQEPKEDTL